MKNIYRPIDARLTRIERLSTDVKLFRLKRADGRPFSTGNNGLSFIPGQFILAGVWGYGEAPFGIASDPYDPSAMEIIVREAGQVTGAMHTLGRGDHITLRGPYGNGYPLKFFSNLDVLLVTGGYGIPPIASLIKYIIKNRGVFGRVHLVYGARTEADLLLKDEIEKWRDSIEVTLTVDNPGRSWKHRKGRVSECLDTLKVDPFNTVVAMCGPGPMVDSIERLVNPMGISDRRIFVSLERKMQCGVGRCQHCVTGDKYVCREGPVFNIDEIDRNWD
ncbi:MAG: FAD/NAD(P)-binding protein [Thermodesulfobacteriota bacterium]